jgi:hypothetical protein
MDRYRAGSWLRTGEAVPVGCQPKRSHRPPKYPHRGSTAAESDMRASFRMGYNLPRRNARSMMNMMAMMNMVMAMMTMAGFGRR